MRCGLCKKYYPEDQLFYELGLYFDSLCYFHLQNYRLDNERTSLFDAIKALKAQAPQPREGID